ncbi:hypothetical protein SAMN05192544_104221 [Paraburkholderia hospita]|jgi:hypothetical protein|nr:hypothetical protein SAMN05192544_104221 [Paraburkholderia hospita]
MNAACHRAKLIERLAKWHGAKKVYAEVAIAKSGARYAGGRSHARARASQKVDALPREPAPGWRWVLSRFRAALTASRDRRLAPGFKVVQLKQQTIQRAELGMREVRRIQKLVEPPAPVFRRQDWPAEVSCQCGYHHARNVRDVLVKEHTHVRPRLMLACEFCVYV